MSKYINHRSSRWSKNEEQSCYFDPCTPLLPCTTQEPRSFNDRSHSGKCFDMLWCYNMLKTLNWVIWWSMGRKRLRLLEMCFVSVRSTVVNIFSNCKFINLTWITADSNNIKICEGYSPIYICFCLCMYFCVSETAHIDKRSFRRALCIWSTVS